MEFCLIYIYCTTALPLLSIGANKYRVLPKTCYIICHFDQVSKTNAWRNLTLFLALLIDFSARCRSVEMTGRAGLSCA